MKYIDGATYQVTFNHGKDCIEGIYIAKYQIFNFAFGSVSEGDVEQVILLQE